MQIEKLSVVAQAAASVASPAGMSDSMNSRGVFLAVCKEVIPERKAEYDSVFQRMLAKLADQPGADVSDLQEQLDAFPMFDKWADKFPNVVCIPGKNLALDTILTGSAYTVVGPYMGLISSVGLTNLATTISSGTYTTGTGAVTLTTAAAHGLQIGDTFSINTAAGTGSFAAINGTFTATSGTTGSTLNFTIAASLTMTITGGNVVTTSPTRINDTAASHTNWTEAGSTNAPTFSARGTPAWSAAAAGTKSTSAAVSFTMTGGGTLVGAFLVYGTGAVTTLMSTAGTLLSAGAFTGGNQVVQSGNVVTVTYSLSL